MRKVNILKGNFGNGNIGDEMLASCINKALSSRNVDTVVLYNERTEVQTNFRKLPFPVMHGKSIRKFLYLIKHLSKSESLVYGGGSQVQLGKGLWNVFFTVKLAKLLGNKVLFHAVGIEEINKSREFKKILRRIINNADYFSVRDEYSLQLAIGTKPKTIIHYASDPCITLPLKVYCNNLNFTDGDHNSNIKIMLIPMDYVALYMFLGKLIKRVVTRFNQKIDFFIVPFAQVDEYAVNKVSEYLLSFNSQNIGVVPYPFSYDYSSMFQIMNSSDFVISSRLHGGVFSSTISKPTIYCADAVRNIGHNYNLARSIGYTISNIITEYDDMDGVVDKMIENPKFFIRNQELFDLSLKRLEEDYNNISLLLREKEG